MAALRRFEGAEGPAQQRHGVGERVWRQRADPLVEARQQRGVVEEDRAASGQEALDERGPGGWRRARRQRLPQPLFDPVATAEVVQKAGGPPAHQAVAAPIVGQLLEGVGPLVAPGRMVDHGQRRLDRAHPLDERGSRFLGDAARRPVDAGHHADHQLVEHRAQSRGVGSPDIAVAQGRRHWTQRVHQVSDVGRTGGELAERVQRGLEGTTEIAEQGELDRRRRFGQPVGRGCAFGETRRGRTGDRRAVAGHLDQADRQLRLPGQLPRLPERAAGPAALAQDPPGHAERDQAMQQARSSQSVRGAQIELDGTRSGVGPQPGRPLGGGQVAGQWDLGRPRRHLADGIADHQLVGDKGQSPEHGVGGVEHLGQSRPRPGAQGGQRRGQAGRGDEVVRRRRQAVASEGVGGLDEEPGDSVGAGVMEHVGVPAGAGDTGAVAGGPTEPPMRPGHPRDRDLELRETTQRGGVGRRGRVGRIERRHVPGTADHGDGPRCAQGPADLAPHVRLPPLVQANSPRTGADGRHGVGDGGEDGPAVTAVLDHVVPPALRIGFPGGGGERGQRIGDRVAASAAFGGRVRAAAS